MNDKEKSEVTQPQPEPPQTAGTVEIKPEPPLNATDDLGTIFDPAVHCSKEGKPIMTRAGTFRRKPTLPGSSLAAGSENSPPLEIPAVNPEAPPLEIPPSIPAVPVIDAKTKRQLAKQFAVGCNGAFITVFSAGLGADFKPENSEENDALIDAWTNYLMTKPIIDIPPGVALMMVLGSYTVNKITTKPTIRERVTIFAMRIYDRLFKRKTAVKNA